MIPKKVDHVTNFELRDIKSYVFKENFPSFLKKYFATEISNTDLQIYNTVI